MIEEATSEMRFIGTKVGVGAQGGSITFDFHSIFSDVYEIIYGNAQDDGGDFDMIGE